MKYLSKALDILQGEKNMFLGYLIPTIQMLKVRLTDLLPSLTLCKPLVEAILNGLEKRLGQTCQDARYLLATITHPQWKDLDFFDEDEELVFLAKQLLIKECTKLMSGKLSVSGCFFL